ncbi:hypothetical protein M3J09_008821 [Ascochyta lentis]
MRRRRARRARMQRDGRLSLWISAKSGQRVIRSMVGFGMYCWLCIVRHVTVRPAYLVLRIGEGSF